MTEAVWRIYRPPSSFIPKDALRQLMAESLVAAKSSGASAHPHWDATLCPFPRKRHPPRFNSAL
jgi:hypothetical protein